MSTKPAAGWRYRAMSRAAGGQPGRSVQRREPVTNTRTHAAGVPSASAASSAATASRIPTRVYRPRPCPGARSAPGQRGRLSAARRSRRASLGGKSRTSRPAGTPRAASDRRYRGDRWSASTDPLDRDGSTPGTTTPPPSQRDIDPDAGVPPLARNMRSTICTQPSALPSANPPPGYMN